MRLDDFSYHLPESAIAQQAPADRASSRLMVVDRAGALAPVDAAFRDLPDLLDASDVVVVNRSRVVPARMLLFRASGAAIEVLFIRALGPDRFVAWVRALRRLSTGEALYSESGEALVRFVEPLGDREAVLRVDPATRASLDALLDRDGHVPLPPYIRRPDTPDDRERYQTVFAREKGSVAAPTAGLHFDADVLSRLRGRGIDVVSLVLHVGPGTFQPLEHDVVEDNVLGREPFVLDEDTARRIIDARASGRRIVAVGTTVTRALETAAERGWLEEPPSTRSGETNLFIHPGYTFRVVDRLVTNFHLPRSSLLLLVSAFLGRERTLECYRRGVERGYRFYSYGDAMLIR
jgi:S-adenosylmethionine:tRNA ribosyltransferase-isomerase